MIDGIKREDIIAHLKQELIHLPYIHALWLEGADANLMVDDYSDIDIWVDVEDANLEESFTAVEEALGRLAPLDYCYVTCHEHPKIRQRFYHLEGSSPYLMIDFCWQLHSRDQIYYYTGSRIEQALVVFDKSSVIRFQDFSWTDHAGHFVRLIEDASFRYDQLIRVDKYLKRGLWPEARLYYEHYVIEPLVILLRILYTPTHTDYGLIHISSHLPAEQVDKLEALLHVADFAAIEAAIPEAKLYFYDLLKQIEAIPEMAGR